MVVLHKEDIQIFDHYVAIQTASPMKVVSSAMHNPGFGYYKHVVNRSVPYTYDEDNHIRSYSTFYSLQVFLLRIQLL